MNIIKFNHRYINMPYGVEYLTTWVTDVKVVELRDLTPEQIKNNTQTIQGLSYPLSIGRKIVVCLWSDAIPQPIQWQTIRSWDDGKELYYKSLIGEEVKIEICK